MSESEDFLQQLRASVRDMQDLVSKMMDDDKYASDNEYCAATERLYNKVRALNAELESENSKLLANPDTATSELNQGLQQRLDNLRGVVDGINTTTQVVGAVASIISFLAPIGL